MNNSNGLPTVQSVPIPPSNVNNPIQAVVYISGAGLVVLGTAASLLSASGHSPIGAAICALGAMIIGIAGIALVSRDAQRSAPHARIGSATPQDIISQLQEICNQVETVGKHANNKMFLELVKKVLVQTWNIVSHLDRGILSVKGPRAVSSIQKILEIAKKPVFISVTPSVARSMDRTLGEWLRKAKQQGKLPPIVKVFRLEGVLQTDPSLEAISDRDAQAGIEVRVITDDQRDMVDQPEGAQANFLLAEGEDIGQVYIELSDGGADSISAIIHFDDQSQWPAYELYRESLQKNYSGWGNSPIQIQLQATVSQT